jgi:hypothetical protein
VSPGDVERKLDRLASSRAARVTGWALTAAWCLFLLVHLVPQVLTP